MKKINHIIFFIIILLIYSCGFTPMLKDVDTADIKISKIEYSGSSELVYFLRSNLNIPIAKTAQNSYLVKLKLKEGATSVTKDTAGVTTGEKITVAITLEIFDENKILIGKENLSGNKRVNITNNISTDSEIRRIEKENIMTNLVQELTFTIRAKIISNKK
tara:strand:+ start:167 stop:649 length:483 start_codon:yes stop_codon:yes gene_type:complete